ncbi:hypothetical protein [Bacillus cereus]|uniref:hypothetical protein n=1 Tax=Bacillus cereus TaxID=1396 RepID=UPI000BF7B3ED|nr:hypothetical protein [Bacillus cereus]PFO85773.1 hypothetical protein COJ89_26860 [Bacillus cereus]PGQ61957.1 hypothetical protein COA21_29590 [Bacillus cereus]PGY68810.1 hypothetical protein COE42_23345 [Bacillus cereus]
MDKFVKDYNKYFEAWSGGYGSVSGDTYVRDVEDAINHSTNVFQEFMKNSENKGINFLKGDIAEFWHAETLKIDSVIKNDKNIFVNVPRDSSPIDISYGISEVKNHAQLKYYKTAEDTVKAISNPKFDGLEKVVPKGQLEGVKNYAAKLAAKNADIRSDQAAQYNHTANNISDYLDMNRSKSIPLSEPEAKQLAQDLKDKNYDPNNYGLSTQSLINFSDIARQSGEAALQAVLLSTVLKAGPLLYELVDEAIKSGEINLDKLRKIGGELVTDAPWTGLRAGIASFLTASCKAGLLGESMKNVSPSVIGAATVVAVNSIRNGILMFKGEISQSEFAERCIRDTVIISFGVLGTSIGQALIPIPILGGLIGNFLGGLLGTAIYQQGNQFLMAIAIEKGWTFFNFVDQDYTVPENILKRAGFQLFESTSFMTESFNKASFSVTSFQGNSIDIIPVKRGIVEVRKIGYR